jgi:hypothetical protein
VSAGDYALLIVGCVVVILAILGLIAHAIRADYRMALTATIAKRNPPRPPAPKPAAGEQANVTDITGRGAA